MTDNDIRPLGTNKLTPYWVKNPGGYPFGGGCLVLILVDELGQVSGTSRTLPWDDAAPTTDEVITAHLASYIDDANRDLERRRAVAPEPKPKPAPMDEATRLLFTSDDDAAIDLS